MSGESFTVYFSAPPGSDNVKAWFRPTQLIFDGTPRDFVPFLRGMCESAQCEGDHIRLELGQCS